MTESTGENKSPLIIATTQTSIGQVTAAPLCQYSNGSKVTHAQDSQSLHQIRTFVCSCSNLLSFYSLLSVEGCLLKLKMQLYIMIKSSLVQFVCVPPYNGLRKNVD